MQDANYFYHLTTKTVALKIKVGGMTSALTRIGRAVANPVGAFAQNRKAMEPLKYFQKLRGFLAEILSRGASVQQITTKKGNYVAFTFVPQGSNEADVPRLTALEQKSLKDYMQLLNVHNVAANRIKRGQLLKDASVEQLAHGMLLTDKNHHLVRLAVQCVAWSYNIEEAITASHIYFLRPKDAKGGYEEYKKHLGNTPLVVLRVHKDNVVNPVNDDSDQRAVMTKHSVSPQVIEVMVNHETTQQNAGFVDENYRSTNGNWQPLSQLT